jgi:hypothetical protein
MLCGDVAPLSLDSSEEREIGDALQACLKTLPSPIGESVALIGPWGKLAETLGGAVLKRMAMITAAKAASKIRAAPTTGPRAAPQSVPYAPPPNGHTTPPPPYDPTVIVAPMPVQL